MIKRKVRFFFLLAVMTNVMLRAQSQAFEVFEQVLPGTKVAFKMTPIPGGTFMLGSPAGETGRSEDEGPQVKIKVDSFFMGVHEVTFDVYEVFRDKTLDQTGVAEGWSADAITRPSPPYEDPTFGMGKYSFPAASMTQYAALSFCKWLWEKTGVFYRLPTEAEWEYAARAGTTSPYFWGEDASKLDDYAWHAGNSEGKYHHVGEKQPNPWGLYDMYGNVGEWTLDQYVEDFYSSLQEGTESPWSRPTKLHPRTVKGGCYKDDAPHLRSATRIKSNMDWKRRDPQIPKSFWWNTDSPFVGFRLIAPYPQPTKEKAAAFWAEVLDE